LETEESNAGKIGIGESKTLDLPDVVWHRLRSETDHELRAALICLLTAALAAKGTAAIIGEDEGGWFWPANGRLGYHPASIAPTESERNSVLEFIADTGPRSSGRF
jgi:hypothetical protein